MKILPLYHFSFLHLLCFLFCLGSESCKGQNDDKNKQVAVPSIVQIDSVQSNVPYWELPYEEQIKIAEPYHIYGKYKLRWQGGKSYYYEGQKDSFILKIKEDFPGILVYDRIPLEGSHASRNTIALEFYQIGSRELKNRIDLEESTPYNTKKFKNLKIGAIDYEYDEVPSSNTDCTWSNLPLPDSYKTYNSVHTINKNGYVCVSFILIKTYAPTHYIVGWEQVFVIINPEGKEIYRSKLDHDTPAPYVSPDGKYLAYTIGSEISINPFETCQKAIQIYDIKTAKRIYQHKCEINQSIGFLDPNKNEEQLIATVINGSQYSSRIIYELLFFNLDMQEVTAYKFLKKEDSDRYWQTKSFSDRSILLKSLPSQTSKF